MVEDVFLWDTADLTLGNTNITFDVISFEETEAGPRNVGFPRTFGRRNHKVRVGPKENYEVTIEGTTRDTDIRDAYNAGSTATSLTLNTNDDSGSYSISYAEGRVQDLSHSIEGGERLTFEMNILFPAYDVNKEVTRSITT